MSLALHTGEGALSTRWLRIGRETFCYARWEGDDDGEPVIVYVCLNAVFRDLSVLSADDLREMLHAFQSQRTKIQQRATTKERRHGTVVVLEAEDLKGMELD